MNCSYNRLLRTINEVLLMTWDPIGINHLDHARDEYAGYGKDVTDLVVKGVDEQALSILLFDYASVDMGLDYPGLRDRCVKAAREIAATYEGLRVCL